MENVTKFRRKKPWPKRMEEALWERLIPHLRQINLCYFWVRDERMKGWKKNSCYFFLLLFFFSLFLISFFQSFVFFFFGLGLLFRMKWGGFEDMFEGTAMIKGETWIHIQRRFFFFFEELYFILFITNVGSSLKRKPLGGLFLFKYAVKSHCSNKHLCIF